MARLKLQMQVTVDGFVANGPNDDLAWNEIAPYSRDLLDGADTIVIGRKRRLNSFHTGTMPRPGMMIHGTKSPGALPGQEKSYSPGRSTGLNGTTRMSRKATLSKGYSG